MALKIAIYGYDSDVGKIVLEIMNERHFEVDDLFPLSPLQGEFDAVTLNGHNYMISSVDDFDFGRADVALFLTTRDESERLVPEARESGCIVIDNSGFFAGETGITVVDPRINPYDVKSGMQRGLIIPASSTASLIALALSPLADEFGVARATVTAMQSVSEQGRLGTETLARETARLLNGLDGEHEGYDAQVSFNLFSHTGEVGEDGYSAEERRSAAEVEQVLGKFSGGLDVTAVQVPVFYGHTASIRADLSESADIKEIEDAFRGTSWIEFKDHELITPVEHAVNVPKVLISRVRSSSLSGKSVSYIAMMDNVRMGEAMSVVDITRLIAEAKS